MPEQDTINETGGLVGPTGPGNRPADELSDEQRFKIMIEALIDYIATTPQNINYNIVREIIKAIMLDEPHPYFNYYFEKINQTKETEEPASDLPTDPGDNPTK